MNKLIKARGRKLTVGAGILVLVVAMGWIVPQSVFGDGEQCYDYPDTMTAVIWGVPVCAYWGTHCIECVAGGGSCIGDADGNVECILHISA